jgi:late competence protein required for DNA uptake (superfamily II DNA/RNA helicase)
MPVLPYQKILYDALSNHKHIWIKKSRGIGCSEFLLRYIAWCCVSGTFSCTANSRVCIITGPRIDLAEDLIARFKALFVPQNGTSDRDRTQSTVAFLNGVKVEAFPSHHVDTMRGLTDVKWILSDESDMYPPFQQDEVRAVSERYIAKSDPYIIMVSTPNAPGGLFQRIQQEPLETCLYKEIFLDYSYGLDKIYTKAEIEKARVSPSFPREYELQYLGLVGNVFSQLSIENCQKIEYNPSK